ncbi:MAG: glucosyl-3-phosphoglycerate synthase [Anaerolineales bacterium]|nr:glucosyl-3-phosphoglycerate synthase [Anaerolineales bacterium]
MNGYPYLPAISTAMDIAGDATVLLAGIVVVPENETLTTRTNQARKVRSKLKELKNLEGVKILDIVHVTHNPWQDLKRIVEEEKPDLMVLEWPNQYKAILHSSPDAFIDSICDMAIVGGVIPSCPEQILLPMRGGVYAELALRISLSINRNCQSKITALHIAPAKGSTASDDAYYGIDRILKSIPEVRQRKKATDNPVETIVDHANKFDMVIMGTTARPEGTPISLGPVAEMIMNQCQVGVIAVKTKRPMSHPIESEMAGHTAISVLVDKWFAENTYHADEFADLDYLLKLKKKNNLSIGLAMPALDEEETVGNVIQTIKKSLMDEKPLLDELILIDSDSQDRTRDIARSLEIPVYIHQLTLPKLSPRPGKGEALWKSLYLLQSDLILWIDTDIVNIHPRFVFGLIGPLLARQDVQFVKGFYRRPLKVGNKIQVGGGGRVTELTARPLLNLFYPELSGVIQPLSGEYGGRRTALEKLPFFSGYGVEIGLLIDMFDMFGLSSIAQVDLKERIHKNQDLSALSKMSFAIIQAVFRKLEKRYGRSVLEELNRSMKLIRYDAGRLFLDVEEIAELDRPPMIDVPEYLERMNKENRMG